MTLDVSIPMRLLF